nr:porin [Bradyrhizobium sp. 182]
MAWIRAPQPSKASSAHALSSRSLGLGAATLVPVQRPLRRDRLWRSNPAGSGSGQISGGSLSVYYAFLQFAGFTIGRAQSQFSSPRTADSDEVVPA